MTPRKLSQALVNKGEAHEKEMDTFALLRQDIKDVKNRLDKMVKSNDIEILVTRIVLQLHKGRGCLRYQIQLLNEFRWILTGSKYPIIIRPSLKFVPFGQTPPPFQCGNII